MPQEPLDPAELNSSEVDSSAPNPSEPNPSELGAVREAWLFTRGVKSVRIVRASTKSRMFLHVYGPDTDTEMREFDDVLGCMRYQAEFERRLVGEGFALERFLAERRSGSDRRGAGRGSDRRRGLLSAVPSQSSPAPTSDPASGSDPEAARTRRR